MKFRLVEILRCPLCQGALEVQEEKVRPADAATERFSCRQYCAWNRTNMIPSLDQCVACGQVEVVSGALRCRECGHVFPIVEQVPWLYASTPGPSEQLLSDTASLFSHVWQTEAQCPPASPPHVEGIEEALGEPVVYGAWGLDAGSGSGGDSVAMARWHPTVQIVSLDMSEGVYVTRRRSETLPNVHVVRGSVLAIPLQSETMDFGYSFGVLHHTTDPGGGMRQIVNALKSGGAVSLYLYEDHGDNPWKAVPLKAVSAIRRLTTRLPPWMVSLLCLALSPFVVLTFSLPARIMARFDTTKALAARMPFNFGTSLFSVRGDLVDRFGAPIELRYSREAVAALLEGAGLEVVKITKLKRSAGWVAKGVKK